MTNGNGSNVAKYVSCDASLCKQGGVIIPGSEILVDEQGMRYHRACAPKRVCELHDRSQRIGRIVAALGGGSPADSSQVVPKRSVARRPEESASATA